MTRLWEWMMTAGLLGGLLLALLGLAFEITGRSMRRTAIRDPAIREQTAEIKHAKAMEAELVKALQNLQLAHLETIKMIEDVTVQVKTVESRVPRVTQDYRVIEEIGVPMAKAKRFDGTVWHPKAGARFTAAGDKAPPGYYANEVQIIIWADSLNEAHRAFEDSYPAEDGYMAVFHGEVFARS